MVGSEFCVEDGHLKRKPADDKDQQKEDEHEDDLTKTSHRVTLKLHLNPITLEIPLKQLFKLALEFCLWEAKYHLHSPHSEQTWNL